MAVGRNTVVPGARHVTPKAEVSASKVIKREELKGDLYYEIG